jgi:hypothetical protein
MLVVVLASAIVSESFFKYIPLSSLSLLSSLSFLFVFFKKMNVVNIRQLAGDVSMERVTVVKNRLFFLMPAV